MLVATFNINGVNKRLDNRIAWLGDALPDIVCLQKLKAAQNDFPQTAIADAGYHAAWVARRSWNGVAILSRIGPPIITRDSLPGEVADSQARYIEVAGRA
jgi:exodeoxyribonuclease-3